MAKAKFLYFLKVVVEITLAYNIAEYINNNILRTGKWYFSLAIYMLIFVLVEVIEGLFKSSQQRRNAESEYKTTSDLPDDVLDEVRKMKESGDMVNAIKKIRELTGAGLVEAKQFVDQL